MTAPLALKRQRAASTKRALRSSSIAEVIVDNGVFHLDEPFSYAIPEQFETEIGPGALVRLFFREKKVTGIVLSVHPNDQGLSLSPIDSVLDPAALTPEMLELCDRLVARYACSRHDILRFAIPKMRPTKKFAVDRTAPRLKRRSERFFYQLDSSSGEDALSEVILQMPGRVLVVTDTDQSAQWISGHIASTRRNSINLAGGKKPSDEGLTLDEIRQLDDLVIIGLRSMLFASVGRIDHLVIVEEWSEHHWERQGPYWNSRDVALIRHEVEGASLHFVGTAMSLELARLIDLGYIKSKRASSRWRRGKRRTITTQPQSYHRVIAEGLRKGPVLISVAGKSYVGALLCARCRTKPLCPCGGGLIQENQRSYRCLLCQKTFDAIRCHICDHTSFLMLRKGAERIAVELGKAFPQTQIFINNAEHQVEVDQSSKCIVISTSGVEPRVAGGYAGLVLLDGEFLVALPHLRAEEEAWQRWSRELNLASPDSALHISLLAAHPIAQSLMAASSNIFTRRALSARKESNLPPYSRMIAIAGETAALRALSTQLRKESDISFEAYPINKDSVMWLKVPIESADEVMKLLRVVQRYRSATKKTLFKIKIDGYQI